MSAHGNVLPPHRELKDMLMYNNELNHEAFLIMQGYQAIARDFAVTWTRLKLLLGFKA